MSGVINSTGAVSGVIGSSVLPSGVTGGSGLDETPLSHRNMIINGGMQVWQRATATTTAASGYTTVDRFAIHEVSGATVTSEKHTMSFAELNTTGHRTALQMNCTVADTSVAADDYIFLRTSLEGQNLQRLQYGSANAKNITLSFWCKSDKTGIYSVIFVKWDSTRVAVVKEFTINSADTWEKKTITVTPTEGGTNLIAVDAGVIDNDNGSGLSVNFTLMVGNDNEATKDTWLASSTAWGTDAQVNWANETNDFYITGVQLELGSVATPFEHRSFGEEEIRCRRYFQQAAGGDHNTERFGIGYNNSSTQMRVEWQLNPIMRSAPTITYPYANWWKIEDGDGSTACTSLTVDSSSSRVASTNVNIGSGAISQNDASTCRANGTTGARIYYEAEL